MTIYFYTVNGPYGCFSNFSPHGVFLDDRYWPTVEHYFQAQKFREKAWQERIGCARSPKEAKRLGWSRTVPMREDWDEVRDEIMHRAVRKKFETHEAIRQILLSTGEDELIENAPSDYYWGSGADGSGQNRLGQMLMEVRTLLRE